MAELSTKTIPVAPPAGSSVKRRRGLRMRVTNAENVGEQFEIRVARSRLGRSRDCEITLMHPSVSHVHAELHHVEGRLELRDFGSTNGSYINDRLIRGAEVRAGDVIRLGAAELELLEIADVDVPLSSDTHMGQLHGKSDAMRELFARLQKFAASELAVLLTGETGTGKELAARAIHDCSPRANHPFLVVDCGALQPNLAASKLFGHARGAFTGADKAVPGVFEQAEGGTVFLDEIGELEHGLQQVLLRVLDRREVVRIGEHVPRPVNVRVVAATHRNLAEMVHDGCFRQDLFFRMVEGEVELPPLRVRGEDIVFLAEHLLERERSEGRTNVTNFSPEALRLLRGHRWPGNVRELRNIVRSASTIAQGRETTVISPEHVQFISLRRKLDALEELLALGSYDAIMEAVDRFVLSRALADHGGKITPAAESIGMGRKRFRTRLIELGLLAAQEDEV